MKTMVIISDTHNMGMSNMPARVLNAMDEADYILHLGDGEADVLSLKRSYGGKVIAVRGNNDASGEKEQVVTIGGAKMLLTHGDLYNVRTRLEKLLARAKEEGAGYVLFGHTHRPVLEVNRRPGEKDLIVLNPGSLSYPRQEGHKPSYIWMEIDSEGKAHFAVNYL